MAQIAVAPYVFKDARISVAADNYEKHLSGVTLNPSADQNTVTWQGLTPATTFTDTTQPTVSWQVSFEYAQDWVTANSLSQYLLANSGLTKAIKIQPVAGVGAKTFSVNAVIVPGPVGGNVNEVQTSSVTLNVIGQPTTANDGVA